MKANIWELSKNGESELSNRYFYNGEFKDKIGCLVFFDREVKRWSVKLWEMSTKADRLTWKQKGKGWKSLATARKRAELYVGDCLLVLHPTYFEELQNVTND